MIISTELHAIANRLARLAPSHRDPFKFHEDKSELVAELRRLATDLNFEVTAANDNRPGGFAPGLYSCIRWDCGTRFNGAKRSWQCEPCA